MPDEELVAAYLSTTWRVRLATGTITIRIGEPSPIRTAGIVTAYNPASQLHSRRENRLANRRLLSELRSRESRVFPAVALGHGPDAGRWREPGFAVSAIALTDLVQLAEWFGQNAIVWISAGVPELVVTRAGFADLPVGARVAGR